MWQTEPARLQRWRLPRPGPNTSTSIAVVIESQAPQEVAASLNEMGLTPNVVTKMGVQATVPWSDLPLLGAMADATRVREPFIASGKGLIALNSPPPVKTEGITALQVTPWHDAGFGGKGVSIVVLDVGFSGYDDLLGFELPTKVDVEVASTSLLSSAHGTAVAEVIYDIAPYADFTLFEFLTDQEFLAAIEALSTDPPDVINASVGFDNIWPADGTSPYSQAVDRLVEQGTVWVAAAGNENDRYAWGRLSDDDQNGILEIDGTEGIVVSAPGGLLDVSFRWTEVFDDPWVDIDLVALNEDGSECGQGQEPQTGAPHTAYERIDAQCNTEFPVVFPVLVAGDLPTLDGYLYSPFGVPEEAWTYSQNLTLPADAHLALTTSACDLDAESAPTYASRGPTEDGRMKPDLCGPSDVSTESFGSERFQGTSASAPHISGLATLVVEGLNHPAPPEVAGWLTDNAFDLGDPNQDVTFGWGAAQAGPPPERACGCSTMPHTPLLGFLALLAPHRRRTLRRGRSRDTHRDT